MSERRYAAYLLRLWQVDERTTTPWRASLEDARGRDRLGFRSVEELCSFLNAQACGEDESAEGQEPC